MRFLASIPKRIANKIRTRRSALPFANAIRRGDATSAAYKAQLQREQDAFTDLVDVHALPDIFHYWSNKFRPRSWRRPPSTISNKRLIYQRHCYSGTLTVLPDELPPRGWPIL